MLNFSRALVSLLPLLSLCFSGISQEPLQIGEAVDTEVSTEHPYNPRSQEGILFEKEFSSPNSAYIKFRFENFQLGGDDHVEIFSPNTGQRFIYAGGGKLVNGGTATISEFWSLSVLDDTAVVRLHSNGAGSSSYGFDLDKVAYGFTEDSIASLGDRGHGPESVCGDDNKEEVQCYSSTTMYDRSEAVCRLIIGGTGLCTGWLLGGQGQVMTNNHCISDNSEAQNTEFQFDYQYEDCTEGGTAIPDIVANSSTLVCTDSELDYSLLQLPNNPTGTYGYLTFRNSQPMAGEKIYIPQHPGGAPKKIAVEDDQTSSGWGEVQNTNAGASGTEVEYHTDTEGGSSGSPVLAQNDDNVIALHHTGSSSAPCLNGGVQNEAIIDDMGACMPENGVDDSSFVRAGFWTESYLSCDSTMAFQDRSSYATSWDWDFGDGSSSTLQNPTHTYSSSGVYQVQLIVGNGSGEMDTTTQEVWVSLLEAPQVSDKTVCFGMHAELMASSPSGTLEWAEDTTHSPIDTGVDFTTPSLTASQDYYVRTASGGAPLHKVGPSDTSIHSGSYFEANTDWGTTFQVEEPMLLRSVKVYSDLAGVRTFELIHQNGVIESKDLFIGTGSERVNLDFQVPPGQDYLLKISGGTVNLYRNDGGGNYPYEVPGLMSITGNNTYSGASEDYFYYFYDWEVKKQECKSEWKKARVEVLVDSLELTGTTEPAGNSCQGSAWVEILEGTPPYSYQWDDPNGSIGDSIDGLCPGTYTVSVLDDIGCEDSITLEVKTDTATSLEGSAPKKDWELRPLPVRDRLILEVPGEWSRRSSKAILYDLRGTPVRKTGLPAGQDLHRLKLSDLENGVYILNVHREGGGHKQFKIPVSGH